MAVVLGSAMSLTNDRAQVRFYLHDGHRVVFFGDSITAQALYTVYGMAASTPRILTRTSPFSTGKRGEHIEEEGRSKLRAL